MRFIPFRGPTKPLEAKSDPFVSDGNRLFRHQSKAFSAARSRHGFGTFFEEWKGLNRLPKEFSMHFVLYLHPTASSPNPTRGSLIRVVYLLLARYG